MFAIPSTATSCMKCRSSRPSGCSTDTRAGRAICFRLPSRELRSRPRSVRITAALVRTRTVSNLVTWRQPEDEQPCNTTDLTLSGWCGSVCPDLHDCWLRPACGSTLGTTARNAFRGPGFFTVDASLVKNTKIHERVNLQLRAEMFNIFNRLTWPTQPFVADVATFGRSTNTRNAAGARYWLRRAVQRSVCG